MAGGREPGGIFGLLDLIEGHRAALRYDWRARFQMSLDCVPESVGWDEALDLVRVLRSDPSSQLAASVEGWEYPLARGDWMLADLIDIQGTKSAGKKWKSYPRPMRVEPDQSRHGNADGRTPDQIKELLRTGFGQRENTA